MVLKATLIPQALLIGVESGGCWGAMKWWVKAMCEVKTAKWHQFESFSPSHNTQNSYVHTSMPNLTSLLCDDL